MVGVGHLPLAQTMARRPEQAMRDRHEPAAISRVPSPFTRPVRSRLWPLDLAASWSRPGVRLGVVGPLLGPPRPEAAGHADGFLTGGGIDPLGSRHDSPIQPRPSQPDPALPVPPPPSDPAPLPPDSPLSHPFWPSLDPLGVIQALGGLLTSYDHITLAGRSFPLPQQWGIPCVLASVATVFIDAQLASRSRLRAAQDAARAADEAARERDRAEQRENEADRERDRAAKARERQRESLERLDQAALLSARVQLDPSIRNRERLRIFLELMERRALEEEDGA